MTIKTSEVIFREDLYPRIEPNAKLIQQYAENIENLPPIEINLVVNGQKVLLQ